MEQSGFYINPKMLWYCLWGAMAAVAFANAISFQILPVKYLFPLDVALGAVAAMQLAPCASLLTRKEAASAATALILFGAAQLAQLGPRPSLELSPDFGAYYVAARLVADKEPKRLYQLPLYPDGRLGKFGVTPSDKLWRQAEHRYGVNLSTPYVYPPFFAVFMRPFVYLSYKWAHLLWNALIVLMVLLSGALCLSLGASRLNMRLAPILIVGVLSYYPVFDEAIWGQVGGLVLLLWVLCAWFLLQNRIWPSAFCFAFASMIKLTPIIAIPLFVFHRKWRWLFAYGCWMVCLLSFSVWQAGWAAHIDFLHKAIPSVSCGLPSIQNASLVGYIQELFVGRVFAVNHAPFAMPALSCMTSKAVALTVYTALMARFYLYRHGGTLIRHLALATLLSLAISPISWWHHYTIALLPFLYLWSVMREPGRDILLLAAALVVGTNIAGFLLLMLNNHAAQLIVAAVVPCLTLALVYFRTPLEGQRRAIAIEVG